MKGSSHPKNDVTINPSGNESILDVISRARADRRRFIRTGISAVTLAALGGVTSRGLVETVEAAPIPDSHAKGFGGIGFESIPPSLAPVADKVTVPPGYNIEVLASWGDPILPGAPNWHEGAIQDAEDQEKQFGMHNDGMHFFPLGWRGRPSNRRGLLCVNHEYTHEEILHGTEGLTGGSGVTIDKVRKSQAAHGVSVLDIGKFFGRWHVNRWSPLARRVTGNTLMRVSGPAAGHALLQSKKFDILPGLSAPVGLNDGRTAFGTLNNCAHGFTPWGTYLACEENWNGYFKPFNGTGISSEFTPDQKAEIIKNHNRYGIVATASDDYKWHMADPRFDTENNPLEPHLFGWVVEIDPFDPRSTPVKRTALGRTKHESAQVAVSKDRRGKNRVAFYLGDDERNEYIYKFVCERPFEPGDRRANRDLLDDGILNVARFTDAPGEKPGTYRGAWIPLLPNTPTVFPGKNLRDLDAFKGVNDAEVQALILIKTRQAADAVGATMMDRPEWMALRTYDRRELRQWPWDRWNQMKRDDDDGDEDWNHRDWGRHDSFSDSPEYNRKHPLEIYCTLTNNNRRGGGGSGSAANNPDGSTTAGTARPLVDAANPRPDNDYGHIIRWREDDDSVAATAFEWDVFVLCGDTRAATHSPAKTLSASYAPGGHDGYVGNINDVPDGSADFGAPDGLWFDQFGRLWIQTDQIGDASGDFQKVGANTMSCADPNTKEIRRFLTSPPKCEVTGVINTPDGRTMFVGIQHPGEDSPANNPTQFSNWPQSQFESNSSGIPIPNRGSRPRSSVLVITREDGGIIGD